MLVNYSNTSSFRGRNQAFSHSTRGGRHDSVPSHVARETSVVLTSGYSSSGKKDENRRTLTDFKIVGLEIPELDWSWKASSESAEPALLEEASVVAVKAEGVSSSTEVASMDTTIPVVDASVSGEGVETKTEASSPPPPSRIRIYFHTPVSADDSHLLSQSSSFGPSSTSGLRKGKRKKLEDDDGDYEDGRGPPPPPPLMSGMGAEHDGASVAASADYDGADMAIGRGSVAPSVAETASEADWLMAAIGEDEGDGEGGEPLHVSEVENPHAPDVGAYGNGYVNVHGDGHDDDHMMGDDDAQGSVVGPDDESAPSFSVPSGLHGPDGEKVAEIPSLNGFSSVSVGDEAHHQGDGPAMAPDVKLHDDGSQTLPDAANSSAHPASPSASRDVSAVSAMPLQASPTLPDLSALSAGQNADRSRNVDSQAPSEITSHNGGVPLQATDSIASTAPDTNDQHRASPDTPTVTDGDDGEQEASQEATQEYSQEATQLADEFITDVFDDGETSPTATTLVTGSLTGSTAFSSDPSGAPAKTDAKSGKTPSANRLSVSYAAGTRRMVVDAEVVDKLRVFRAEGRIEVSMNISSDDHGGFKGILIEGYSEATASYVPLEVTENTESDPTVPPFSKATIPSRVLLIAYLDRAHPLSEARWVKSGDVQEWLRSIFGRMFWVSGDAADGWEKRIEIADPDPAPTIWNLLEQWAQHSANGTPTERQRFPSAAAASQPVAGPLLAALSPESAHAAQQTHVSLAVLAIFRLAVEYAKKAAGEKGKGEAEERVGEIIRALPSHLLYKSLDGIFKEWRAEKKGGRT
ncbi:hypothetical protein A0H81_08263 [Grifola frondosa]|uniref:Uncharacterized protein n=1 Tax=Grifola frondosa TaxID=5627 RepID=A0A1C7MA68_GRIFR|nr:hypothetical protein A0H81_08263 [Grifola frondosa]